MELKTTKEKVIETINSFGAGMFTADFIEAKIKELFPEAFDNSVEIEENALIKSVAGKDILWVATSLPPKNLLANAYGLAQISILKS